MNGQHDPSRIIVIGAGPAGVRAAQTLVAAGLRPLVIDENARAGGQIYRQPPPGFVRDKATLYGFEARRADSVHQSFAALSEKIDYLPHTLAWHCADKTLDLLVRDAAMPSHPGVLTKRRFSHLLLCTGALDRTLPFEGWTLPGVYTLGAAQVALKAQGCAIGRRVVLAGAGPLLYLVAYQYAKAGADIAAVLDMSSFSSRARGVADMASLPALLAKGVYYLGWLRAHRVPVIDHVDRLAVTGTTRVAGVRWWSKRGGEHVIDCDAVATGFGLRSETQLADLVGCAFDFDAQNRQWLPRRDAAGRSSVAGVYLAGDGSGIAGADAAERGGQRAALALLEDLGHRVDQVHARRLEAQLARIGRFRRGVERAFPTPVTWARRAADETIVCRCEAVRAGDIRTAIHRDGAVEMNRLKALCRAGMGRCQGRICSTATAEILAQETGVAIEAVGRWRAQPPIKPLPIAAAIAVETAAVETAAVEIAAADVAQDAEAGAEAGMEASIKAGESDE